MNRRLPLIVLAAAAILPILIFSAGIIVLFNNQQQETAERDLRQVARSALLNVERKLVSDVSMLQGLAASPAVDEGDYQRLQRHMTRVLQHRPDWLSVQLVDARTFRVVVETAQSGPSPAPDEALVRKVVEQGEVEVSDLHAEQGGMPPYVALAVPVIPRDSLDYVLVATIDVTAISAVLATEAMDPEWMLGLIDRNRTVLARSRFAQDYVGSPAAPSLNTAAERSRSGYFFARNKDGQRIYGAFVTSGWLGWVVEVGAPADVVERPLRRTLLVLVGAGSAALGLAVLLTAFIIRVLGRRQKAERRLLEMEAQQTVERRLTDIAANLPGVIYRRMDHPDGTVSHPYMSDGLERLIDVPPDEVKRKLTLEEFADRFLAPADQALWRETLTAAAAAVEPYHVEVALTSRSGQTRWVHSTASPHRIAGGAIVWDGVMLDITGLKQAEERLEASLAEKETLLREIHHRVRNNLQVISSLLQLEIRNFSDPDARERVNRISQRIAVLGKIHDQLYTSENFARIDFAQHLEQLCANLRQLYAQPREVAIELDAERLYCELETAIPLGLVANELITNSLKHGVSEGRPNRIRVALSKSADGAFVQLHVEDEGGNPPPDPAATGSGGLGMRIVRALAAQINAELAIENGSGWRVTVTLPGDRLTR